MHVHIYTQKHGLHIEQTKANTYVCANMHVKHTKHRPIHMDTQTHLKLQSCMGIHTHTHGTRGVLMGQIHTIPCMLQPCVDTYIHTDTRHRYYTQNNDGGKILDKI